MRKIICILSLCLALCFLLGCQNFESQVEDHSVTSEPALEEKIELPGALMVSIDNHSAAYPQSGLDQADIVYEMLAEGGITRYVAIFYSEHVEKIGPVRSARPYFVELAYGHNMPLAHAGGSMEALTAAIELKIKDIDEIYNASRYFWRSDERKMPHNLYTSTELLLKACEDNKYSYENIGFIKKGTISGGSPCSQFKITYSNHKKYPYIVGYTYDGTSYTRSINGEVHRSDVEEPLEIDNIIVLEAETKSKKDGTAEIKLTGSGPAVYFCNANAYQGQWERNTMEDEFLFTIEGEEMKFNKGKTWINVVPDLDHLTFDEIGK